MVIVPVLFLSFSHILSQKINFSVCISKVKIIETNLLANLKNLKWPSNIII